MMVKTLRSSFIVIGFGIALNACTAWLPPPIERTGAAQLSRGQNYTVKETDNIYTIAQKNKVRVHELIAINNMKRPYLVKPGQILSIPAKGQPDGAFEAPEPPMAAPLDYIDKGYDSSASAGLAGKDAVSSAPLEPIIISAPVEQASAPLPPPALTAETYAQPLGLTPPALDNKDALTADGMPVFGWPLRGTIISTYGPKGNGRDNDGINIGAPKGAPVKAAAGGLVVYAGQGMKGFGNLVLVKHANGWVTAYAHMDRLTTSKDSSVSKGDMIGTVGSTGGVSAPQLHFEVRRDGVPVDPELVIKG